MVRLLADIDDLLARKRAAPEMGLAPPVASIDAFIERELDRLEGMQIDAKPTGAMAQLNDVLRAVIRE